MAATVFAGAGEMVDPNNEGDSDSYEVHRLGFGLVAVLRGRGDSEPSLSEPPKPTAFEAPPLPTSQHDSGVFGLVGFAEEVEWTKLTWCGIFCRARPGGDQLVTPGPWERASKFGWRAGVGYSFSLVEFRVGLLQVVPSSDAAFPESFLSPDVVVRVGRRSLGWFELGLGAYDASTVLRPGAYLGGSGGKVETVRVTGHVGIHLVNGLCCQTLIPFGGIAQLDVEHAVGRSVVAGADFKVEAATGQVLAGSFHLAFLL